MVKEKVVEDPAWSEQSFGESYRTVLRPGYGDLEFVTVEVGDGSPPFALTRKEARQVRNWLNKALEEL